MDLDDQKQDGRTVECPACGGSEWMHPEMTAPEGEPFFCGGCGHVFGTWREVHARLFVAGEMLAETLQRRP